MNTKLKGRKLDLAQLGKAIVDSATDTGRKAKPAKKPASKPVKPRR